MKHEKNNFEILLSCMNQKDFSIVERSKIKSNVLIVNQYTNRIGKESMPYLEIQKNRGFFCRKYNLQEKGLSKSRNFALRNSQAEICLFADDDEIFCDGYEEVIQNSFTQYSQADVIIFHIANKPKRVKKSVHRVRFPEVLKVTSYQIAFRRKQIIKKQIWFDEDMGAGTGNGAEEEVKFLLDCLKKRVWILNIPVIIASIEENSSSTWFEGFDEKFFENRGMTTRYMLGKTFAILYGGYYVLTKRSLYQGSLSVKQAWQALKRGITENRLEKIKNGRG